MTKLWTEEGKKSAIESLQGGNSSDDERIDDIETTLTPGTSGAVLQSNGSAIVQAKVTNTNVDNAAAIAKSKLNLTGAILNADLAGSIAYSKLSLTGAVLNTDLAGSIAYSKLALTGAITKADLVTALQTAIVLPERAQSAQSAASGAGGTFAGLLIAPVAGTILKAYFIAAATPAAGESMVKVITKNGSTIGSFTYNNTKLGGVLYEITLTDSTLAAGDRLATTSTYTAGGTPTPLGANAAEITWIPT